MTEKIDFQAFMAGLEEGQNAEYEAAFNAYCDLGKLEADRTRFLAAADQTTGVEHDSNIRKIVEIDTAISKVRATLKAIHNEGGISSAGAKDASTTTSAPKKSKSDALDHAIAVGRIDYLKEHGVKPTVRALFDWLAHRDSTGTIVEYDYDRDRLTWKKADGGLRDIEFKSFQNRKPLQ